MKHVALDAGAITLLYEIRWLESLIVTGHRCGLRDHHTREILKQVARVETAAQACLGFSSDDEGTHRTTNVLRRIAQHELVDPKSERKGQLGEEEKDEH